jgi:hypothetical protein
MALKKLDKIMKFCLNAIRAQALKNKNKQNFTNKQTKFGFIKVLHTDLNF